MFKLFNWSKLFWIILYLYMYTTYCNQKWMLKNEALSSANPEQTLRTLIVKHKQKQIGVLALWITLCPRTLDYTLSSYFGLHSVLELWITLWIILCPRTLDYTLSSNSGIYSVPVLWTILWITLFLCRLNGA